MQTKRSKENAWLYFYLHISIRIFLTLFICFVLDGLCNRLVFRLFCSKHSIIFENTHLLLRCWFHCVEVFYIKFRLCETFTVINSVTRILFIETLYRFRTIKCWFTLYLPIYTYKFNVLYIPPGISHSTDVCTATIKNIWNMQAVSTYQIADILHFNDKH